MNKIIVLFTVFAAVFAIPIPETPKPEPTDVQASYDDIVVESALNIRKPVRQPVPDAFRIKRASQIRNKRQFGGFGQSSALANAAAQNQYFGPQGFGGSAANAQGQAFNAQGPLGGFGAAATGAQTQSFNVGPNGFTGSAGLSGSQTYDLPGNAPDINVSYGGTYSVGPDGRPTYGNSNAISFGR